jgi:glyoxylase-like metal-dependent hydrolase (beta-lactamase superfamily II)
MTLGHEVPEISPEELVRRVESGGPLRVLDVRAPAALAQGHVDVVPPDRFLNIRGSEILAMGAGARDAIQPDGPIAVVCGRGNSSKQVASALRELGVDALSMRGGMAAWSLALVPRELPPPPGFDRFLQFDRIAKGAVGYLLAADGEAVLIDPPRKSQPYLEAAREAGLRIVAVADTHAHADYISGGPSLSRSLKVPYYLHPLDAILPFDGSQGTIAFTPAENGTEIPVGKARLRVEHTPGHTEGSVTYRAGDAAAMTGDFVFIRSVGRPDLGGQADAWTVTLWKSLERARREWPRDLRVYPAHYASDAEREPDHSVGRAFGAILDTNEPLGMSDQATFVAWVASKVGNAPEAYRKIKAVNLGLLEVWDMEAQELESGKNACALG